MLRSLRHRVSTTKQAGGDGDSSNHLGEKGPKLSKPKACSASILRTKTTGSKHTTCVVSCKGLAFVFLGTILTVLMIFHNSYMMGDGYSSNGGVVGELVDQFFLASYEHQQEFKGRQGIFFPDVTVKATRRTEQAHYSQYLEEILRDHQSLDTSIEPMTTQVGASSQSTIENAKESVQTKSIIPVVTGATASFAISKANDFIQDLRKEHCHSNWMCQRCLNSPYRGSYEACAALCRRCYVRILSTIPGRNNEQIRISGVPVGDRIPRIVHQAWHFYPRSLEYPEISRLMAGWRAAKDYQYYFYDGYDAQTEFVKANFPPLIEKALNAIPSRVSRLAFFRLLVLYKVGGVFADVNLMLETNLDSILEDPTTFVAARAPGMIDNCLWVGFIAAAPGHPVLAKSIENTIRSLLLGTHLSSVALERDLMGNSRNPYKEEIWKFRSKKEDYLFKDCSLGLAYNQILGSPSTTSSIMPTSVHGGFQKILLMVNHDAGATRLTDLSSNVLVASGNLMGVSEISVHHRSIKYIKKRESERQENDV